jgi:GT2 family glycosyltransferase
MAGKARTRWVGELEGIQDGLVFGWCVDSGQPDARVILDICINGETSGTVIADIARTDLLPKFRKASREADACHGFVADLRVHALNLPGVVTARVANSAQVLPGRVTNEARVTPPPPANTFVFGDGGLRLHGWCRRRDARTGAFTVRALLGAREIARATADEQHPTLRPFGVEAYGFVLDLPPELADGNTHEIRVVDGDGIPLNGSPLTVCCLLTGATALVPKGKHHALHAAIESFERYVPRSLGIDFYEAWRKQFEDGAETKPTKLRAAIVITGSDAAAVKRTRASLAVQTGTKPETFATVREALESKCDAIGFVRAGDELVPHALATAMQGFENKRAQVVYTDSEFAGRPWFKPAWNLDYALASDYPLELMLVRRDFARRNQPARPSYAQPADFAWSWLAAASVEGAGAIVHVPRAVYVWNAAPGERERKQRTTAAQSALRSLDERSSLEVVDAPEPLFEPRRMVRKLSAAERKTTVTLIIPTRDRVELLSRCIDSIRKYTKWASLEIIIVDNDSVEPETHKYLRAAKKRGIRVLEFPGPFNFSAMNNAAVKLAKGSVIGLINNDIEALHAGWLEEIVSQLLRPGIAAVGAKLVWPNEMVQHGGVLLGVGNAAGHFGNRLSTTDWGDHGRNQLALQVSGVTAACLFMRKKDYIAVGGMDEQVFPVTFNDVDLCLKLRARGDAIVWTPFARLLHAESASRGKEDAPPQRARAQRELDKLRERWGSVLLRDPAYHPSLNLDPHSHPFGGLAIPPRDRSPRGGNLPT